VPDLSFYDIEVELNIVADGGGGACACASSSPPAIFLAAAQPVRSFRLSFFLFETFPLSSVLFVPSFLRSFLQSLFLFSRAAIAHSPCQVVRLRRVRVVSYQ